jgi:hypothetical protein
MTKQEIEELIKSVNRNAIKAMLRNTAALSDENATDEMKMQAIENIKAIAANKPLPKKSKIKSKPMAPVEQQPIVTAPTPAPTPAQQPVAAPKIEYPQGLHLHPLNAAGHDENAMRSWFDALPDDNKKSIVDWHAGLKLDKSINTLYNLFSELKKRL